MSNQTYQKGNYVVNHWGQVWCIEYNEMIYQSTYEKCVEFVNNITAE